MNNFADEYKIGVQMKNEEYINPFSAESEMYARRLDEATITRDVKKLEILLNDIESILPDVDMASKARFYYSIGTVYSDFAKLKGETWESSLRKQLYCFRKSIECIEKPEYSKKKYGVHIKGFKCILYINYGNALSSCGRIIEAILQYKKVLDVHNSFGMALGNLGRVYRDYGILDYDASHQHYFHHFAYSLFQKALNCTDPSTHREAKECFRKLADNYDKNYIENVLSRKLEMPQLVYESGKEEKYRRWSLENGLFLNTLNDLPVLKMCFAADVLQLPDMIVSIDAKPVFHGMFNQIKQEYIYARYQYYCSLELREGPHFADKETHLINFADYPQYGIRIEQLKSAFKTLYGLFDKTAYFINAYFDLGIRERDVSFSHIWFSEYGSGKKQYSYKNVLNHKENFALASLYWISRDFYDKFEDSPNPHLRRISDVRNALEHKYVKVTKGWFPERENGEIDDLAFYVTEDELSTLTLELMRIVRETIICLSLCVHEEERKRHPDKDKKMIMSVPLMEYDDDWKI